MSSPPLLNTACKSGTAPDHKGCIAKLLKLIAQQKKTIADLTTALADANRETATVRATFAEFERRAALGDDAMAAFRRAQADEKSAALDALRAEMKRREDEVRAANESFARTLDEVTVRLKEVGAMATSLAKQAADAKREVATLDAELADTLADCASWRELGTESQAQLRAVRAENATLRAQLDATKEELARERTYEALATTQLESATLELTEERKANEAMRATVDAEAQAFKDLQALLAATPASAAPNSATKPLVEAARAALALRLDIGGLFATRVQQAESVYRKYTRDLIEFIKFYGKVLMSGKVRPIANVSTPTDNVTKTLLTPTDAKLAAYFRDARASLARATLKMPSRKDKFGAVLPAPRGPINYLHTCVVNYMSDFGALQAELGRPIATELLSKFVKSARANTSTADFVRSDVGSLKHNLVSVEAEAVQNDYYDFYSRSLFILTAKEKFPERLRNSLALILQYLIAFATDQLTIIGVVQADVDYAQQQLANKMGELGAELQAVFDSPQRTDVPEPAPKVVTSAPRPAQRPAPANPKQASRPASTKNDTLKDEEFRPPPGQPSEYGVITLPTQAAEVFE